MPKDLVKMSDIKLIGNLPYKSDFKIEPRFNHPLKGFFYPQLFASEEKI
jgi:hypothetical protein